MSLRVLIVDDEALARSRLRRLLGECTAPAAEVAGEAANAADALEWLRRGPVDLALLDIHMPGADGLKLAQVLRSLILKLRGGTLTATERLTMLGHLLRHAGEGHVELPQVQPQVIRLDDPGVLEGFLAPGNRGGRQADVRGEVDEAQIGRAHV